MEGQVAMGADDRVSADDTATMAREITLGISSAGSSLEMTPQRLEMWSRLQKQISEIIRRGGIVEIPE